MDDGKRDREEWDGAQNIKVTGSRKGPVEVLDSAAVPGPSWG